MIKEITVSSLLHKLLPSEDSTGCLETEDKKIIVVGDGITRDPFEALPGEKDYLRKLWFMVKYPRPSPAKAAAEILCNEFVISSHYNWGTHSSVEEAFEKVNTAIEEYNTEHFSEPDYLTKDFAGCVGAGAHIVEHEVFYGFIADAGIAVFDAKGDMKRTTNEGPNSKGSIDHDVSVHHRTNFLQPAGRKIIRQEYRNNPDNPLAYGALTGEENATKYYLKTGYFKLSEGSSVVAFTDGLEQVLELGKFRDALRSKNMGKIHRICQKSVKTEGSLVVAA